MSARVLATTDRCPAAILLDVAGDARPAVGQAYRLPPGALFGPQMPAFARHPGKVPVEGHPGTGRPLSRNLILAVERTLDSAAVVTLPVDEDT